MSRDLVKKAVDIVGTQTELARLLGVTPGFITKLLKTGDVPAAQCRKIEAFTRGQVTAEELRPDVFCKIEFKPKKSVA